MINKEILMEYVKIISGYGADPNRTLVDFSLTEEKRNIVNLVNNEAKKDKKLNELLENLKYSNNKTSVIEAYFNKEESKTTFNDIATEANYMKEKINNYGFINLSGLASIVGIVTLILMITITLGTR